MRKVLIVTAIASLAFAGGFIAGASPDRSTQAVSKADAGIDIFSLTRSARDLPEQSFPAH
jgi:hypothetical protein